MVDEPVWQRLTEEDLCRVRGLLVRGFLATLVVLGVVSAAVEALDLGKPAEREPRQ